MMKLKSDRPIGSPRDGPFIIHPETGKRVLCPPARPRTIVPVCPRLGGMRRTQERKGSRFYSSHSSSSQNPQGDSKSEESTRAPDADQGENKRFIEDIVNKKGVIISIIRGWEKEKRRPQPIPTVCLPRKDLGVELSHPRYAMKVYGIYHVRLANIVDPSNFFMEFIIDPPNDGCSSWDESLQVFYNSPGNDLKCKMRTLRPFVGQQYAYFSEKFKKWERVRVQTVNYEKQEVNAFLMDRLYSDFHVPFSSLYELHPKYANWGKYPINGQLRDVVPKQEIDPTSEEDVSAAMKADWSEEANDFFKNYTKDKTFWAFVVTREYDRQDNLVHLTNLTRFAKLTVVLFNHHQNKDVKDQYSVNTLMVTKGYASPIKSMRNWKSYNESYRRFEAKYTPGPILLCLKD